MSNQELPNKNAGCNCAELAAALERAEKAERLGETDREMVESLIRINQTLAAERDAVITTNHNSAEDRPNHPVDPEAKKPYLREFRPGYWETVYPPEWPTPPGPDRPNIFTRRQA